MRFFETSLVRSVVVVYSICFVGCPEVAEDADCAATDSCCPDGDADAVCDDVDNCPTDENGGQEDFNGDGLGDACDSIHILLEDLSTDAIWFDYDAEDATVAYFAVLDGDGGSHVAFDACDVCYQAGKGYRQEGDEMVCNNCGNRFDIEGIGTENTGGGCWPGYLAATETDVDVVIEPETLEDGSWYFE